MWLAATSQAPSLAQARPYVEERQDAGQREIRVECRIDEMTMRDVPELIAALAVMSGRASVLFSLMLAAVLWLDGGAPFPSFRG